MAEGTASTGSIGGARSSRLSVGIAEGFSSPGHFLMAVVPDVIRGALAKGGVLRALPVDTPHYDLGFQRNPYDPFSNSGFDRRQRAGFDYNGNRVADRHEVREKIYGNSVSLYSKMMGLQGYSSSGGAGGFNYSRSNFVGGGGCNVDYSVM